MPCRRCYPDCRKTGLKDKVYLVGASLKDLGRKCFGFTKMAPAEIARLKTRI